MARVSDPVGFWREVLGSDPWEGQIEIFLALRDHTRVTVRAGHGVGFTAVGAVLWRLPCFSPSVVLTTAPTHRQGKEILWREIRRPPTRGRRGSGDLAPAPQQQTAGENRKRWEAWKAAGIDPTHGGEAMRKRGEAIAGSNRLKPRRG